MNNSRNNISGNSARETKISDIKEAAISDNYTIDKHPIHKNNIIIAPHREKRPVHDNKVCPFCPGSPEVPEITEKVIFLQNKYASLNLQVEDQNQRGICEVIVYTVNHNQKTWKLSNEKITDIIHAWKNRTREIMEAYPFIKYIFFFENNGEEYGASILHPHGQMYAFPFVPNKILRSFTKECVFETNQWHNLITIGKCSIKSPHTPQWPHEFYIVPEDHIGIITDLDEDTIADMGKCVKLTLYIIAHIYSVEAPYMLSLHMSPIHNKETEKFHHHLYIKLITPKRGENKMKILGGVELETDVFINPINQKVLIERYHKLIDQFYSNNLNQ